MDRGGNSYSLKKLLDITREKQHLVKIKIFYCYALAILYNLIFCENIKIFENNVELNKMYSNLDKTTDDTGYIAGKLFYIYEKFYKNSFSEPLNEEDFYTLIFLKKQLKILKTTDNKAIEQKMNNISIENKESIILEEIKKRYFSELLKMKNTSSYNEIHLMMKTTILQIVQVMNEDLTLDELLLILGHLDILSNKLYNGLDTFQAEQERERLLNGDMSKEIEMQKQAVEYSNVQNGYEFEEYVANLYKKLGYTIEKVTKKSGDQGADVIAYKDNKKYVIQVKFYNNPVGNKAVQEVVGAIGMYKADKGIVVTNSTFTPSAIELALANNIELVDGTKIEEYKKNIVNNVDGLVNDNNSEEAYIKNIIIVWKNSANDFINDDVARKIMHIGISYYNVVDGVCDNEKIQKFLELLEKYSYLDDELTMYYNSLEKETMDLFIKAGIFIGYMIKCMNKREYDNDYEAIMDTYVNAPDLVEKAAQVLAVSKLLNMDIEETANEISNYIDNLT